MSTDIEWNEVKSVPKYFGRNMRMCIVNMISGGFNEEFSLVLDRIESYPECRWAIECTERSPH